MLSTNIQQMIKAQIVRELNNHDIYFTIASFFENNGLSGFAKFLTKQSQGEIDHATKFKNYLSDHQVEFTFAQTPVILENYNIPLDAFTIIYQLEQKTTQEIQIISQAAMQGGDYTTFTFLDWFRVEQVEEEKTIFDILDKIKNIGSDYGALLFLDQHLEN